MANLLDLVLHPIRMRIFMALAGREMTAQQISESLGDVPPATLYRQLNRLTKAGLLAVVAERRKRGTVEKVYGLRKGVSMTEKEFAALSREELLRYYAMFLASLLDDFTRYLKNREPADMRADRVSFTKFPLEVTDKEFAAISKAIDAALLPYVANKPAPGRKRRIGAIISMPDFPGKTEETK